MEGVKRRPLLPLYSTVGDEDNDHYTKKRRRIRNELLQGKDPFSSSSLWSTTSASAISPANATKGKHKR